MLEVAMLLAALAFDLAVGELPAAVHPVVWIGKLVGAMERLAPRGNGLQLVYGAAMVAVGLLAFTLPAWLLLAHLREGAPVAYFALGALVLKSTFSVRGLFQAAEAVRWPLAEGRLAEARFQLRSLVSRETGSLGEPLLAAAAVESVAENTGDSFVAPLFWYLLLGVPGALAYRVINTYDAMVGYHGKYEYLGKAAARLDDLANLAPARITGLLLVAAGSLRGGGAGPAWRAMWRYRRATESPNAGWPMGAMAGALGVRLEKVGHYRLGDGADALTADTIGRSEVVAGLAMVLAASASVALMVVRYGYFA